MTTGTSRLSQYLQKASADLPAMPVIANQVILTTQDPARSIDDLRGIIEKDPAIAAQILKASNSAIFGVKGGVQNLTHAISLLGMKTIRNLVLSASMKQTLRRFGLMEKLLLEHSVVSGHLASKLAARVGLDRDDAFTAGLLHDIGKTALANSHHDEYEQIVQRVYNEKVGFCQAEREFFGFDHAELGVAVAMNWSLPDALITVIGQHHSPETWSRYSEAEARLTALVAVSSACLSRLGVGRGAGNPAIDLAAMPAWELLGFTAEDTLPLLEQSLEIAGAVRATLS